MCLKKQYIYAIAFVNKHCSTKMLVIRWHEIIITELTEIKLLCLEVCRKSVQSLFNFVVSSV